MYPVNPNEVPSCAECGFLDECGGLEGEAFRSGCFQHCNIFCALHGCDMVCPSVPLLFGEYFEDVGGICVPPRRKLVEISPARAPFYIPQINHGWQRDELLCEPWITIPLYFVARRDRRQRYRVRFSSGDELRRALRVPTDTRIIVTSVVPDGYIEDLWAEHKIKRVLEKVADLKIDAMTVPNYSFMLDAPRTNSLYNLSRIFRMSEAISDAGIATILHLNASTPKDWDRWRGVLSDQTHITSVCTEFQTGPSCKDIGDKYFERLVVLQDSLGRELHPFVLAGGGRLQQLRQNFRSFTVIDSVPFMKTIKRQLLYERVWKWRRRKTPPGASLSPRLATNIERYRNRLLARIGIAWQTGAGQLLLPVQIENALQPIVSS
ncbi:MAG: hypothetical protein QOG67_733 [Verrucomicrobiota bacterium]